MLPDVATVEDPKFIVRELVVVETSPAHVKLKVEVKNDPFVTVNEAVPIVKASANVHSHPTPLTVVAEASAIPLVVMVLPVNDPDNVIVPV